MFTSRKRRLPAGRESRLQFKSSSKQFSGALDCVRGGFLGGSGLRRLGDWFLRLLRGIWGSRASGFRARV